MGGAAAALNAPRRTVGADLRTAADMVNQPHQRAVIATKYPANQCAVHHRRLEYARAVGQSLARQAHERVCDNDPAHQRRTFTGDGFTMKRREFLRGAAIGGVAAASLAAPAIAQDRKVVKMVTTWPKGFPGLGVGAQRVADRITAMTDGRITVKLYGGGELVPALESFDAVSAGTAEMYHGADYYWVGKHPAYAFFTAVPMGFTYQELNAWIHFGGGQELWDELGKDFGVKGIMAGNTGPQMGGWFRNPINSIDDMKGLKMRMPGLGGKVLNAIGGSSVTLAGGEIFAAFKSGAIDATEWVGPYNDLAFGFQQVAKNYMYPGFHEPGSGLAVGMNMKWWESLSKSDQAIVEAACTAENDVMLSEFNARNPAALAALVNEHGVNVQRMPDEVFKALADASEQVVSDTQNHDALAKKIYESYSNFRASVDTWTRIADEPYTLARRAALGL